MNINELVEQLTESQALELHYQFARKFGWAGTLYVREDAEYVWNADNGGGDPEPISDEQWQAVKTTQTWLRLGEYISTDGLELVRESVREAKTNLGEYTVWVGGVEVNDHLLTQDKATALAKSYLADGYEDIKVVNTTTNIVLSQYEWSK